MKRFEYKVYQTLRDRAVGMSVERYLSNPPTTKSGLRLATITFAFWNRTITYTRKWWILEWQKAVEKASKRFKHNTKDYYTLPSDL